MTRAVTLLLLLVIGLVYGTAQPAPGNVQECGPNEQFNSCGSSCVDTCKQPASTICSLECVIGCQCKEGYVRNSNNQCVLVRDC